MQEFVQGFWIELGRGPELSAWRDGALAPSPRAALIV